MIQKWQNGQSVTVKIHTNKIWQASPAHLGNQYFRNLPFISPSEKILQCVLGPISGPECTHDAKMGQNNRVDSMPTHPRVTTWNFDWVTSEPPFLHNFVWNEWNRITESVQRGIVRLATGLGWLWFGIFPHLANLLSHFCPFPIGPGRARQSVEQDKSKSTQPSR